MAGKVKGMFFKAVLGSMMESSVNVLFPKIKDAVARLGDDEWHDWDKYVEMVNQVAEKSGPVVTRAVGTKIVVASKEVFLSQGFDSLEKLLQSYPAMFSANVKDVPETVKLVSFEPNAATFHYAKTQPQELIEGYFLGFFKIFNKRPRKLDFDSYDADYYLVTVEW